MNMIKNNVIQKIHIHIPFGEISVWKPGPLFGEIMPASESMVSLCVSLMTVKQLCSHVPTSLRKYNTFSLIIVKSYPGLLITFCKAIRT